MLDMPPSDQGEVLVNVAYSSVNYKDALAGTGKGAILRTAPLTGGIDLAGEVQETKTRRFRKGDIILMTGCGLSETANGGYSQYQRVDGRHVLRIPKGLSSKEAMILGTAGFTAALCLHQMEKNGQTPAMGPIVVTGASGGVGLAAVQLARAAGMTVIGTAGTEKSQRLVSEEGAQHVLDHHDPNHLEQALELTGGNGINVILEMLANVNLGNDLKVLAKGGRVVVIGSRGDVQITPRDLMGRDASVLGMSLMNSSKQELTGIHAFLVAGLENGTLRPVVGKEMPLTEAAQAHHLIMESSAYGQIVLTP